MPANQSQIGVPRDQIRGKGMLQDLRTTLLDWKVGTFSNYLKVAKELRPAEFSSLPVGEQVVRAIRRPLAQPGTECSRFVKKRLPVMLVDSLYGVE